MTDQQYVMDLDDNTETPLHSYEPSEQVGAPINSHLRAENKDTAAERGTEL